MNEDAGEVKEDIEKSIKDSPARRAWLTQTKGIRGKACSVPS